MLFSFTHFMYCHVSSKVMKIEVLSQNTIYP